VKLGLLPPGTTNKVLRRIFRLERKEVEAGWRKLHDEDPHNAQI